MGRSGIYVKNFSGDLMYRSFKPAPLPPNPPVNIDESLQIKLGDARQLLGELNTIASLIPDDKLFIYAFMRKESLISSQIEGTQATLEDIFNPHTDELKRLEVDEVNQYTKALDQAIELSEKLPLSNRFIKKIHKILLSHTRGEHKNPGEFRNSQNWIGHHSSSLADARFIPPNVDDMHAAMNELELFIHDDEFNIDPIVKIALIHYQFETIHPFLDGNGRIGRLLILLLLREYGLLTTNVLYISYYLKKYQTEYYDRLNNVRNNHQYEEWVSFFVSGLNETLKHTINMIKAMMKLQNSNINKFAKEHGKTKATLMALLHYLERQPIIDISIASKDLGRSYNTIASAVNHFVKLGMLSQLNTGKRNRLFVYDDYLALLQDGTK
ncbi:MAG: Adenosine monophosphate-protein transferase SoFic [Tenericutes bacterium ADurb.Bin024]|jgi:Fic family protein|nr:MAG: Adenosine monophosphate-protein transferase SoFic [Tenericutes bacterium ADurb.Bin024]